MKVCCSEDRVTGRLYTWGKHYILLLVKYILKEIRKKARKYISLIFIAFDRLLLLLILRYFWVISFWY